MSETLPPPEDEVRHVEGEVITAAEWEQHLAKSRVVPPDPQAMKEAYAAAQAEFLRQQQNQANAYGQTRQAQASTLNQQFNNFNSFGFGGGNR